MVHPSMDVVLLSTVALGSLVIVSQLLLLLWLLRGLSLPTIIVLTRSALDIPLGASMCKMPLFPTLEASIAPERFGVVVSRRGTDRSVLSILLGSGALSWLLILLVLLSWALVLILILPKVDILSSCAVLVTLQGSKARARIARLAL